jgi:hypothetical protein
VKDMMKRPFFLRKKQQAQSKLSSLSEKLSAPASQISLPDVQSIHKYRNHELRNKVIALILVVVLATIIPIFSFIKISKASPGDFLYFPKSFIEKYVLKNQGHSEVLVSRINGYKALINSNNCIQSLVSQKDLESRVLGVIRERDDLSELTSDLYSIQNIQTECVIGNLFTQYSDIAVIRLLQDEHGLSIAQEVFNQKKDEIELRYSILSEKLKTPSADTKQENLTNINLLLLDVIDFIDQEEKAVNRQTFLNLIFVTVEMNTAEDLFIGLEPKTYQSYITAACNILAGTESECNIDDIQSQINSAYFKPTLIERVKENAKTFEKVLGIVND